MLTTSAPVHLAQLASPPADASGDTQATQTPLDNPDPAGLRCEKSQCKLYAFSGYRVCSKVEYVVKLESVPVCTNTSTLIDGRC